LVRSPDRRREELAAAVHRTFDAVEALERNPNEKLLLQALLWSLPEVGQPTGAGAAGEELATVADSRT
jgi:hypothetical protein